MDILGMFFGNSSNKDYDKGYEPGDDTYVGSGRSGWLGGLFGDGASYRDYEVKIGGKDFVERQYDNGQVYLTDDDGKTTRVK